MESTVPPLFLPGTFPIYMAVTLLVPLFLGYLFGSIPFGLIITRLAGVGDVRKIGSGNIGATNVLRTGRKGLAAATLVADALKGAVPVWLLLLMPGIADMAPLAAFGAFLGHLFPVWLRFKGGKGIAVYIGALIAISLKAALVFGFVWLVTAAVKRYSSLAALLATLATPIALYVFHTHYTGAVFFFTLMTVLAWFKHRGNISRLMSGTEPKIGGKE